MVWNKLIEQDRITSVCAGFCEKVMERIKNLPSAEDTYSYFRKKHIWMSIAAGVLLGLLLINIQYRLTADERRASEINTWINGYYLNDMTLDEMDCHLF